MQSSDIRFLGAQVRRSFMGPTWVLFTLISVGMCLLSVSSLMGDYLDQAEAGTLTAAFVFGHLMRLSFASLLFATVWGAMQATSEFRDGSVGRTTLFAHGKGRAAVLSALATVPGGALMGLFTTASTTALVGWAMVQRDLPLTWNSEIFWTVVGLFAVSALAAPWGNLVGWLIRQPVLTLVVLVAWTLMIETLIVKAAPDVARFLPGGAQSAIILDLSSGNPFAAQWGYLLFAGYLALAGVAAVTSNLRRDLV